MRNAEIPSDEPCVMVKTNLRPSTYRAFAVHAKELGVDVGDLLSRLADRALAPKPTPRTRRVPGQEDDIDRRIRELNGQGKSDNAISRIIGLSQSSVSARRRDMHLESPTPRHGGRRKAA